jgi:F-type H+-transporting ATPase subunit delta
MDRQVASRYAEALFPLAWERKESDRVEADLKAVVRLLADLPDFSRMLEHPEVSREHKFNLLDKTIGNNVLPTTMSFLKLLVKRRRSGLIGLVEEEYERFAYEARGIEKVEVTASVALTPEQNRRLEQALVRMTGKKVEIKSRVDARLLAGVKVQIGDRVIDGSAAGRLEALRSILKETGG